MSSLSKARDASAKPNSNFTSNDQPKNQQVMAKLQAADSSFTLWRKENNTSRTAMFHPSLVLPKKTKIEESDEDLLIVPDVEPKPQAVNTAIGVTKNNNNYDNQGQVQQQNGGLPSAGKRRRGRNPIDKEHKRLKRLLRNRVSAQQARERKKVYVNDLESRAKELLDENARLEERISTLTKENAMLRKVLMNTRPTKCYGSNEPKDDDQLSKS